MTIEPAFFEIVANLIPVLLIALSVERFASTRSDSDRHVQLTTGVAAISLLTVAECFSLTVVARGATSDPVNGIVISALAFGWMLLVMAYTTAMLNEIPPEERGTPSRRRLNLGIISLGIFCPVLFLIALFIAAI